MTQDLINVNRATGEIVSVAVGTGQWWEVEGSMPLSIADLRPPLLRIVQSTTRNVEPAAIGKWLLGIDQTVHDTFSAIIVGLTNRSRAMFAEGIFDRPPVCSSDDNVVPRSVDEAAGIGAGPTCAECPFSRFRDGGAPLCSEAWNFLGVTDDEERLPFLYRAAGTAIAPARTYVQPFYFRKRPLFTARTTLTTKRVQDDRGVYYVPVFEPKPLAPEEAGEWAEVARGYLGFHAQADYPEHRVVDVEPVSVAVSKHEEINPDDLPLPPSRRAGPPTNPADDLYAADPVPPIDAEAALWESEQEEAFEAFRAKLNAPSTPRRGR